MVTLGLPGDNPDQEVIEFHNSFGALGHEASHYFTVTPAHPRGGLPSTSPGRGYDEWMIRVLRPRQQPGWQMVVPGVLLLCAFIVPGIMLLVGQGEPAFNSVDTTWQAFAFTLHSPFWDGVNAVLNGVGYAGMLVLHGVLAAVLFVWRRPLTATFVLVSGVTALALTQLGKVVVGRERPVGARVLTDTGSYPSGHVSATTAFLMVLAILVSRWWMTLLAALGVIAMMISRTYLSAHWLSDVLGGACLAGGVVLILWWRFRNVCVKENETGGPRTIWAARASRRLQAGERAE
ncbi:PAP2 superfamily protein [Arthrobacter sp. UNCCL28]|nr:PAP2 superfamily protein [Arthrobacter sp. UNCCL28]